VIVGVGGSVVVVVGGTVTAGASVVVTTDVGVLNVKDPEDGEVSEILLVNPQLHRTIVPTINVNIFTITAMVKIVRELS